MLDDFILPLACQAIPRLCSRFGIDCSLPEEIFPVGVKQREVEALNKERERMLVQLFSRHGVSIWEVFDQSGIGEERSTLAKDFVENGSSVLDVASGRGYFAFAVARRASRVTAVDIMDDAQRAGWWNIFKESSRKLGLDNAVNGIRSSASNLPLKPGRFRTASCIHSIRNMLVPGVLQAAISEASKMLSRSGELIIAESSLEARSSSEETYVAYLRLRTEIGWKPFPLVAWNWREC